ncbi:MAG TPA: helix-turn-helix domain-containing protein [Verrucomicrobiae bacterium]|nr:helix-turn-helix domain-containing protein [Verrucomicrobiae bacterium]
MNTKFNNVADAAAQLAEDPSVSAEVQTEVLFSTMVSVLLNMRVAKGLTQEDVAKCMECDPSKISRLEAGNDRQLRWMDIVGYARALKVEMSVIFDDSGLPAAERIKHCVFRIDEDLEKLGALAKELGGEDQITKEIDRFYRQVLFNFLARFKKNSEKLGAVLRISAETKAGCVLVDAGAERKRPLELEAAAKG